MASPVVFFAFSNQPDAYLETLKTESKELFRALSDLDRQEFVKVHREESADVDALYEALVLFPDRIAIFHYGGHADGATLHLEGGVGHAEGIAGLLGQQKSLKLVFLNGCATRPQVDGLLAAGVRAVIATSVSVRDDEAMEFAKRFYQALGGRHPIGRAFSLATDGLKTRRGHVREVGIVRMRDLHRTKSSDAGESIPWGLYVAAEHADEVLNWSLPGYRAVGLSQQVLQDIGSHFTTNRYIVLVLDEMVRYNPDINAQLLETRGGESMRRDSREYPELIIRNLPWPLGSQVRLLRQCERPDAERLEHLVSAYVRTTQLLYYILLSDLWERVRRGTISSPASVDFGVPNDEHAFMSFDFLAKTIELHRVFDEQDQAPYVAEFGRMAEAWAAGSGPLRNAHAALEELRAGAAAESATAEVEQQCETAEKALAVVLRSAAFLARYRMLTVRNIAVEAHRFQHVAYELNMGPLNAAEYGGLELYQDIEHRRKTRYGNSHSIVLARNEDDLDDGLNLSPFIVDKNTFVSVTNRGATGSERLAHVFVMAWSENGRPAYLAVDHSLRYALENWRDRIHTDMTREDFMEGRNIVGPAATPDPFGFGDELENDGEGAERPGAKVFQVLRDQFDAFNADLGARR